MDVHRGPAGNRRIIADRPDHSRVFAERGGHGYVQHPYSFGGREFNHRTYFVNGRAFDRFYNRYQYNGLFLDVYAPRAYFAPAFYGWAYNPWRTPMPYAWAWAGSPWSLYYGAYFTPYPMYPSASLWLTDYVVSTSLAAAYQQQLDAGGVPPPVGPVAALTPGVKQLVAAEVQRQLALENAEQAQVAQNIQPDPGSSGIARLLSDNNSHVFVAGSNLDLFDAVGNECGLTPGDVVQMVTPPPPGATDANVVVLATKGADCPKGSSVLIALTDLQDMQNYMRETIDQGLAEIQSHPGGLPALPQAAQAAPIAAPFAAVAPPPDPNAGAEINQEVQAADQLEQQTAASPENVSGYGAGGGYGGSGPPATVTLGLTFDQVAAILGQPEKVADLGAKKTWIYSDMKVVFTDGRVSDIQ